MMYTNYIDYNLFLRVANHAEFHCPTPVLRMASALEVQAPVTFSDLKTWVIGI